MNRRTLRVWSFNGPSITPAAKMTKERRWFEYTRNKYIYYCMHENRESSFRIKKSLHFWSKLNFEAMAIVHCQHCLHSGREDWKDHDSLECHKCIEEQFIKERLSK